MHKQIKKLLAKISKGQASVEYYNRKMRSYHKELRDNISLVKTSIAMIFHCIDNENNNDPEDPELEYSSDSSTDELCSSQSLREKNEKRSDATILISDEANPSNRSPLLHLSTFLATPNPDHINQPMSQNTMTNISRLLNHTESRKPH